jgi:hypothetical protein
MKASGRAIGLVLAAGFTLDCTARILRHDERVAADRAEEFLTHAVVKQDFVAAYQMLSESGKNNVSQTALVDIVRKQHPNGYPASVRAIEFEAVPGQPAVQVFLLGETDSEKFYYRVPLVGTVDQGYSPDGIYRGRGPYPQSPLRQPLRK